MSFISKYGNIIKGKFLVDENSTKNWKFMLFLALLAIISIAASHNTDKKMYKITKLQYELKELKAEFVSIRTKLIYKKTEKRVAEEVKKFGLEPSKQPPVKIQINQ